MSLPAFVMLRKLSNKPCPSLAVALLWRAKQEGILNYLASFKKIPLCFAGYSLGDGLLFVAFVVKNSSINGPMYSQITLSHSLIASAEALAKVDPLILSSNS